MRSTQPEQFSLRGPTDWWGTIDLQGRTLMGKPVHKSWSTPPPSDEFTPQVLMIDVGEFDATPDVLMYIEMICFMDIKPEYAVDAIHMLIHGSKHLHHATSV
jgi:hypothetical protein